MLWLLGKQKAVPTESPDHMLAIVRSVGHKLITQVNGPPQTVGDFELVAMFPMRQTALAEKICQDLNGSVAKTSVVYQVIPGRIVH